MLVINLPAYVLPTAGAEAALGPAKIRFCLAPPDIPADKGGATFGAKFLSAALTLNGVLSPVVQGAWIAIWTRSTKSIKRSIETAWKCATQSATVPRIASFRLTAIC